MSTALTHLGPLLGRILIAIIFVLSGYGKITGFDGTVSYIASKGLLYVVVHGSGPLSLERQRR